MKNVMPYKLFDLPKGSKLYGFTDLDGEPITIIFDHLDGMYSYCYLEGNERELVHLSAVTPFRKFEDGYKLVD